MIRPVSAEEGKQVARFFEGFGEGLSVDIIGESELMVREDDASIDVLLASPDLLQLPDALLADADHAGLRIGSLEDGGFALDLQGAILLAARTRRQVVRVSEKASRLFLYGRDILGDSVKSFDPRLDPGDVCIVANPRWEAIGLGEVMGRFKGQTPAVRPIHDLGTYLRDQEEGR